MGASGVDWVLKPPGGGNTLTRTRGEKGKNGADREGKGKKEDLHPVTQAAVHTLTP